MRRAPAGVIRRIRTTPVSVPLEAPIRYANGAHWGRFARTLVQVETEAGLPESSTAAATGDGGGAGPRELPPPPRR